MLRETMTSIFKWLSHVIREPREELDRWQRAVRYSYDLVRYGARQLREDRAPQMAAALSYQALFALVPVLVVAMIIVRALKGVDDFLTLVDEMLTSSGLGTVEIEPEVAGESALQVYSLKDWLDELIGQAANVDLTAVTWFGVVVIAYAATSILVTIEKSFNTIYRAPEGRPWSRRLPLYWSLLTVSPLAVAVTAVLHGRVEDWAGALDLGVWFATTVGVMWSVSVGWLFWFAVYSLVPNTSVDLRASAIGAFVCVVLLEIGKRSLSTYLGAGFAVSQLFGSLGLIPLFMFWVYLMWLAVLFGLEVSATIQFVGNRAFEEMQTRRIMSGLIDPASTVTVMQVVTEDFHTGQGTSLRKIADRTGLPERTASTIVQELCGAGLLHRIDLGQNSVCLAQPPEQITAERVIDVGFRLADAGGKRWVTEFTQRLRAEQRSLAGNVTLASLAGVG